MTPAELQDDFQRTFQGARFSAGLLVAFIDLLTEIDAPSGGYANFADLVSDFPLRETNTTGNPVKQLEVFTPSGGRVAIRGFYNRIETFFRAEKKRFLYPSSPGHATSAWRGYIRWLDALVTYSPEQLSALRQAVVDYVLAELPAEEIDPNQIQREPALFELVLTDFDLAPRGAELTGAALQGLVFGFLRADNPHLQIEVDKVRAGGRRLGRVGDVAGWSGTRLSISAEVKQYVLTSVTALEAFASEISQRNAIGIVAALGFSGTVAEDLESRGLIPLSLDRMLGIVRMWDAQKQRIALDSALYYFDHIEKSSALRDRVQAFIIDAVARHAEAVERASAP